MSELLHFFQFAGVSTMGGGELFMGKVLALKRLEGINLLDLR
jgi:hypothetical protein